MGWSLQGATKMAGLRAYVLNGGTLLELVRYQKKDQPKAVGGEYDVLSSTQLIISLQVSKPIRTGLFLFGY